MVATYSRCACATPLLLQGMSAKSSAVRSRGSAASVRRSSSPRHGLKALMMDAPPAPLPNDSVPSVLSEVIEQADELVEEFVWARGLIPAGECFEQFGWTESAPPLKDVRQPVNDDQRRALASCLATPFMYDDEHLSKHIQDKVSKTSQENNRNLTNRCFQQLTDAIMLLRVSHICACAAKPACIGHVLSWSICFSGLLKRCESSS